MILGLIIQKIDINIQKIDSSTMMTYNMIITSFLVQDKFSKNVLFLEKTSLLADTSLKILLKILFLIFFNINMWFIEKILDLKGYTIIKALSII